MQIGKQIVVSAVDQKIQTGAIPEFLQQLLTNPASANQTHQQQLEALVQAYPQCSVFHLLLAKALQNSETEIAAKALQTAAVHAANREVLFRLIYEPELIIKPKPNQLYSFSLPETPDQNANFIEKKQKDEEIAFAQAYPVEIINTSFIDPKPVAIEDEETVVQKEISDEEITDAAFIDPKPAEIEDEEADFVRDMPEEVNNTSFTNENLVAEESVFAEKIPSAENTSFNNSNLEEAIIAENDFRVEDVNLTFINEPAEEVVFPMEETLAQQQEEIAVDEAKPVFAQEIDEEVYDEITAIEDIRFELIKAALPEENLPKTEPVISPEETPLQTLQDKAEKDMLSSIASIDYFTFNNRFGQNKTQPNEPQKPVTATELETADADTIAIALPQPNTLPAEKEPETVSKYHDDKMPYTFMWWLDKTRKEYAGTYQPYAKNVKPERTEQSGLSVGPELHQQYIESIFHAKAPHNLTENTLPPAVLPPLKRKEDLLIERFIIEEPHIHPPSMDKLDTENKAKKSSEDGDVLVTETLAKIYLDQMLYHKALDTYQKLVLKFPEKSRYFAAQIDLIEKKIN